MLNFFRKNKHKRDLLKLEESKIKFKSAFYESLEVSLSDLIETRTFYEKLKSSGNNRFNFLLDLCIQSSVVNSDLLVYSERIRLSEHRYEKIVAAKNIALTAYEYLKDINTFLGKNLQKELKNNGYNQFIDELKDLNSKYADLNRKHDKDLYIVRNNISAHKIKDSLSLLHLMFSIETEEMFNLAIEIISINTELTHFTTKIFNNIKDEAKKVEKAYKS